MEKIQELTPKQRDGVYGTMRPWISFLGNERIVPWIRDTGELGRAEFTHRSFADTTDTLYLISREGGGSARALTAALAMAVLTASEKLAGRRGSGRLSPPLMAVLDEAANVVRWRELPDLYTIYLVSDSRDWGKFGVLRCHRSAENVVYGFFTRAMLLDFDESISSFLSDGLECADNLRKGLRLIGATDVYL